MNLKCFPLPTLFHSHRQNPSISLTRALALTLSRWDFQLSFIWHYCFAGFHSPLTREVTSLLVISFWFVSLFNQFHLFDTLCDLDRSLMFCLCDRCIGEDVLLLCFTSEKKIIAQSVAVTTDSEASKNKCSNSTSLHLLHCVYLTNDECRFCAGSFFSMSDWKILFFQTLQARRQTVMHPLIVIWFHEGYLIQPWSASVFVCLI